MENPLRENFKDWIPGSIGMKYSIDTTSDGSSSITDVTDYAQTGDEWTASVINATNTVVNELYQAVLNARNPITGAMGSLYAMILSLYELHRNGALTASEYDALGLTASEYDSAALTASQYDQDGKTLLGG